MKLLRWLFKPRQKEVNRVRNIQAVRQETREDMPGFWYYGDIEENRRKAAALREQAKHRNG
jgi:hypothetical protein